MKTCEIFPVTRKARECSKSFSWKWRYVDANGEVKEESDKAYALYYECVTAARESGYQPQIKCR